MKPAYNVYKNAWFFYDKEKELGPYATRKEAEIALKIYAFRDLEVKIKE